MNIDKSSNLQLNGAASLEKDKQSKLKLNQYIVLLVQSLCQQPSEYLSRWSLTKLKRVLFVALALFFMSDIFLSWVDSRYTQMAFNSTQVASDLVMHSQRLGKAAPNAIQGNPAAFRQLEQSRMAINQEITVLLHGGEWHNRYIPAVDSARAEQILVIQTLWGKSDKTASQILAMEKKLTGFRTTLKTLNEITPVLLELSEQIANLLTQTGASPREVAAAGQLVMLTQRLGKSLNEFMTPEGINQETAFMLGKVANTFQDSLTGFNEGSPVLRLPALTHAEARARLSELQEIFKKYYHELAGTLKNIGKFITTARTRYTG